MTITEALDYLTTERTEQLVNRAIIYGDMSAIYITSLQALYFSNPPRYEQKLIDAVMALKEKDAVHA